MNDDVNRSSVGVNLKDVKGQTIKDRVELKFYNQRAESLNQLFSVEFNRRPRTLPDVPAFPFGLAEVFINVRKYRYKSIFVNVPAGKGKGNLIDEVFFVEPGQVKPVFPDFADIKTKRKWAPLWRVLQRSRVTSASAWNELENQQKAGLFNLYAKMQREVVNGGRSVFSFVDKITDFLPARVFAMVQKTLHDPVRDYGKGFHMVSGALHDFGEGWNLMDSFKTFDAAGNLQLTFAQNAAGDLKADIDIDDHQGIEHAADVLKHKITGKDTHPYDIHEILIYFQGLDPGYELL
jgi:hypothetical protein